MPKSITALLAVAFLFMARPLTVARAQDEAPSSSASDMDKVLLDAFQRHMVADPTMMETIRSLQDDPAFQDALDDPEIAAALEAGDTTALMANPKVSALVNHPRVRALTDKLDQ